jgi:hypothetical protein
MDMAETTVVYCMRCVHDARCEAKCAWTRVGHARGCPLSGSDDSGTGGEVSYHERVEHRNEKRIRS